ncbi:putative ribonuclease H-like domain-containing protein [Tanacetum coccineum]
MLDQTFVRLQKLNTHAIVWRNKADLETMSMDDLYNNLKVYESEVKGMSSSISTASTQVNAANSTNIDNLSDVVIYAFFTSRSNSPKLVHEDLQQIHPDDMEDMDLRWQIAMLTIRARKFFKNTRRKLTVNGNETIGFDKSKNKESSRRSVLVETSTSTALVSCDGLGGYDWSDQAKEGPNYAFVAFSSSSPDSECQIVVNCKKGLGYENYNALPPPYTGNFMPPTPDLSFIGLDKLVNKPVVENCKAMSSEEEPKVVRKNDDAPWNMSYLIDYEEIDGGYVAFGGNPKGGKITRKVPKGGLTCLFAKATSDESKLWHRRLGHLNFKTMNKLVKGNLVRGLPSKLFENDQTCVACQKGKQHRASCKSKTENSISLPLHLLHMDLFGPTFVKSLMKKMYCLVVTDDYSRFTWVFFLATKDETSGILKSFITGIENLVDHKVKVIRCDNGNGIEFSKTEK